MGGDSYLEATEQEGDGTAEHEAEASMTGGAVMAQWAPTSVCCRPSLGGWRVRGEAEEQHVGATEDTTLLLSVDFRVADAIDDAQSLFVSVCSMACQWLSGRQSKIRFSGMIEHWRALLSLQHSMQTGAAVPRAFDADARSYAKLKILILKNAKELILMLTGSRVFFWWLACDIIKC